MSEQSRFHQSSHLGEKDLSFEALKRQVKNLKTAVALLAVIISAGLFAAMTNTADDAIIRTKGLIIEDADGNPRILLGAPFPQVEARKRQDQTTGFVLMDENGVDRVTIGSPTLVPQIKGQVVDRISGQAGIVVNDKNGDEKTGYGVLDTGQVVLGMDYPGQEALVLYVDPNGYTGIIINGQKKPPYHQRVFLGTNNKEGQDHGVLVINDNMGTARTMHSLTEGKTSWKAFDKDGNLLGDALELLKKKDQ